MSVAFATPAAQRLLDVGPRLSRPGGRRSGLDVRERRLRVNAKFFALVGAEGQLIVKLPAARAAALVTKREATQVRTGRSATREWVGIPMLAVPEPDAGQEKGTVAPPDERLIAVLGERPDADETERDIWDRGAVAIERYRERYGIQPEERTGLGPEPPGRFEERRDRNAAAIEVLNALEGLDRSMLSRGRIAERILDVPGLVPEEPDRVRDVGWEL